MIENYLNSLFNSSHEGKENFDEENLWTFCCCLPIHVKDGVLHDDEFYHCVFAALPNSKWGCFPSQDVGALVRV